MLRRSDKDAGFTTRKPRDWGVASTHFRKNSTEKRDEIDVLKIELFVFYRKYTC